MIRASTKTNSKVLRHACVDFVQSLLFKQLSSVDSDMCEGFDVSSFDAAFYKEVIEEAFKPKIEN